MEDILHERRRIRLEGSLNFRQLGGYPTQDGQTIRWNLVYRSDLLGRLTDRDLEVVADLGLQTVCDFRSKREQESQPSRFYSGKEPRLFNLGIEQVPLSIATLRDKLSQPGVTDKESEGFVISGYRALVRDGLEQYRKLMHLLCSSENLPILFHCAGGKDRTGFAAAIILSTLGVSRDIIFEDYLFTNQNFDSLVLKVSKKIADSFPDPIDPAVIRPLLLADEAYLNAAFEEIDKRYRSFEGYLREGLGIGDREQDAIRHNLLE